MDKGQTSRPDTCRGHSIDSLYAYFERWLLSIEELNRERFAANKEAVAKAEEAQKTYNAAHNDLTRKMEVQATAFVGQQQFGDAMKQLDQRIGDIKSVLDAINAAGGARREVVQEHRQTVQWTVGQVITVVIGVAVFVVALMELLRNTGKP